MQSYSQQQMDEYNNEVAPGSSSMHWPEYLAVTSKHCIKEKLQCNAQRSHVFPFACTCSHVVSFTLRAAAIAFAAPLSHAGLANLKYFLTQVRLHCSKLH